MKTFFYTLPFALGILLALVIRPLVELLQRKFKLSPTMACMLSTGICLAVLFSVIGLVALYAVRELTALFEQLSQGGFEKWSKPIADLLNRIPESLQQLDPQYLERNKEEILDLLRSGMDLFTGILGAVFQVLTSLPTIVTMLIVTLFTTFFIARDLHRLTDFFRQLFSDRTRSYAKNALKSSNGKGQKYLLCSLLMYLITFCEATVILVILGLPYPLTTGFITATADILPVLGPGLVFGPMALYRLICGDLAQSVGLLVGWAILSVIRQIIEPKLIAGAIKIHPLAMLASIYFSLVSKSLWILLYMVGFFTLHASLREAGALPELLPGRDEEETPHASA